MSVIGDGDRSKRLGFGCVVSAFLLSVPSQRGVSSPPGETGPLDLANSGRFVGASFTAAFSSEGGGWPLLRRDKQDETRCLILIAVAPGEVLEGGKR